MVCSPPPSRSTPSMVRRLEPMPEMRAPRPTRKRHRSWTWGSQAALPIPVRPSARTAAMIAFSVAVTDASSRNIDAPRSRPTSSSRTRSKLAWTPREGKAGWWVWSGRRPITSRPGGGSRQWPVLATSGAASSTDARMRVHRTGSSDGRRRPRGSMRTWLGPLRSTVAPVEATSSSIVSTSRIWGTLCSTTGSSASSEAATMGRAAFLFPAGRMVPLSGCPPLMTKLSITLPAPGRSGARRPTLPWPDLGPVKLRPRRLSRPARTLEVPVQDPAAERSPDASVQACPRHARGRRPAGGHRRAGRRPGGRGAGGRPAGRDRLGQDALDGRGDRAAEPAGAGHGAQQDARGPAHQRVQGAVPRQRRRVLRLLLRLLPARGLHPPDRHLHREGLLDERGDRPAAPLGHPVPADPAGRDRGRLGVGHLRPRLPPGGPRPEAGGPAGGGGRAARSGCRRKRFELHYDRNDLSFVRGKFRVRGDTLEVFPAYEERAMRLEFFGDEVERILVMDPVTGEIVGERDELYVFPATHYVAGSERMRRAIAAI